MTSKTHLLTLVLLFGITACAHRDMKPSGSDSQSCPYFERGDKRCPCLTDKANCQAAHMKNPAAATQIPAEQAAVKLTPQQMKELMLKNSLPGDNHKLLEKFVGNWSYEVRWWKDEGAEPEIGKGSISAKLILGKRFVEQQYRGTMSGQPFEGLSILGYDNAKNEYTSLWLDNTSTGVMSGKGKYDPGTKLYSEKGNLSCPVSGAETSYRATTKWNDDNTFVYEIFNSGLDGKEYRSLEVTNKRHGHTTGQKKK